MRAGSLRSVVRIDAYTDTRNSFGEQVKTWAPFAVLRADVMPTAGMEGARGEQVVVTTAMRFRARYIPGITTAMRAVHDSVIYNIVSVINVADRSRMMEVFCDRRENDEFWGQ